MRWTERQRAMLEEMGIRLWVPATAAAACASDVRCRRSARCRPAAGCASDARRQRLHLRPAVRGPASAQVSGARLRASALRHRADEFASARRWTRSPRARPSARLARSARGRIAVGVRQRHRAGRLDGRRRRAGCRRRCRRRAVRRPSRPAARQHARRDAPARAASAPQGETGLRHAVGQVPAAGRPRPGARRGRALPRRSWPRQVGLVQPRLIIAMGRVAAQVAARHRRADRRACAAACTVSTACRSS